MAQNLKIKRFFSEFTRQADVTPYTAQDAVGSTSSGTTMSVLLPVHADDSLGTPIVVGGSYQIKSCKLCKSTNSTTNATFDVYLYTSGMSMTYQDNQEFGLLYANKHVRVGKVAFTLATAGTTNSTCAEQTVIDNNITFKAASTTLSYQIVATAAYTPGASEKFYFEVEVMRIDD